MQSLTKQLKSIGKAFDDAMPGLVSHYYRAEKKPPYLTWAEEEESTPFYSDNHKTEQSLNLVADYYTLEEYDQNIDTIQQTLDDIADTWRIDLVTYEEETELIHYSFSFEVLLNGEI